MSMLSTRFWIWKMPVDQVKTARPEGQAVRESAWWVAPGTRCITISLCIRQGNSNFAFLQIRAISPMILTSCFSDVDRGCAGFLFSCGFLGTAGFLLAAGFLRALGFLSRSGLLCAHSGCSGFPVHRGLDKRLCRVAWGCAVGGLISQPIPGSEACACYGQDQQQSRK